MVAIAIQLDANNRTKSSDLDKICSDFKTFSLQREPISLTLGSGKGKAVC